MEIHVKSYIPAVRPMFVSKREAENIFKQLEQYSQASLTALFIQAPTTEKATQMAEFVFQKDLKLTNGEN